MALELNKEIKRLSLFVEEFDRPFRCDGDSLDAYKKVGVSTVDRLVGLWCLTVFTLYVVSLV